MALTVPLYHVHVDDTCNDSDTYSVWCSVRATCNIIRTIAINGRVEITIPRDSDPRMCDARARTRECKGEEAREVSFACPRILRLAMKYAIHLFTTPLSNVVSDNMMSRLILTLRKQFFHNQFTHFKIKT